MIASLRFGAATLIVASSVLLGCDPGDSLLIVNVRVTGLQPAVDFDRVAVTIERAETSEQVASGEHRALPTDSFAEGFLVSDTLLPHDSYHISASLFAEEEAIRAGTFRLEFESAQVITLSFSATPCSATTETCDGTDEDCDGLIDEEVDAPLCPLDNGIAACIAGSCEVSSCDIALANCDGSFATGCETNTNEDNDHCGACGVLCEGNEQCERALCRARGSLIHEEIDTLDPANPLTMRFTDSGSAIVLERTGPLIAPVRLAFFDDSLAEVWSNTLGLETEGCFPARFHVSVAPVAGDGEVHALAGAGLFLCAAELRLTASDTVALSGSALTTSRLATYSASGELLQVRALPVQPPSTGAYPELLGRSRDGVFVMYGRADAGTVIGEEEPLSSAGEYVVGFHYEEASSEPSVDWVRFPSASWSVFGGTLFAVEPQRFRAQAEQVALSVAFPQDGSVDLGDGESVLTRDDLTLVAIYRLADGAIESWHRALGTLRALDLSPSGGLALLIEPPGPMHTPMELWQGTIRELSLSSTVPRFAPNSDSYPAFLRLGSEGDVYLASTLEWAADFGGGFRLPTLPTAFVAAYGPGGDYRWDWVSDSTASVELRHMDTHRRDLGLAFAFDGTADFGSGIRSSDVRASALLRWTD